MVNTNSRGFVAIAAIMLVALAVGGGAAYYFYTQVQNLESTPRPETAETTQETTPIETQEESQIEVEVNMDTTALETVGDYEGSGRATRIFEDGEFTHTVVAILDDPSEGKFYEGWLVTKTPELDFISTGRLTKSGSNYTLEFRIDEDYSEYNEVVITEETEANGLDGIPEDHVLEGAF